MNDLGVHALVFSGGTSPQDIELIVDRAKNARYDLIELSLHDSENLDVSHARRVLEKFDLEVVCSRGLAFDADVSSDDLEIVKKGSKLLQDSLEITHALGGAHFSGALYSALGKYSSPLTSSGYANVVSVLRELSHEAHKRNMTLGIEVCNRYETNVVNTAHDALNLIDDIGNDNVLLHLDTYHMNIEESDIVSPVLMAKDRLGYVHIGENHRGYLGGGHIDFASFFRALSQVNYQGIITFESFSSAVVSAKLSNDLAIWRNLWDDGPALAAHARLFMLTMLEANNV